MQVLRAYDGGWYFSSSGALVIDVGVLGVEELARPGTSRRMQVLRAYDGGWYFSSSGALVIDVGVLGVEDLGQVDLVSGRPGPLKRGWCNPVRVETLGAVVAGTAGSAVVSLAEVSGETTALGVELLEPERSLETELVRRAGSRDRPASRASLELDGSHETDRARRSSSGGSQSPRETLRPEGSRTPPFVQVARWTVWSRSRY
jgi:hypothetical protein